MVKEAKLEVKSDPYKIAKLVSIIVMILAVLVSWIFAISATQMRVSENSSHLLDLENRMRVVEKSAQRTNVLLDVINKKLDRIDKRLNR